MLYLPQSLKRCASCVRLLPLSEFNKNRWRWDGLQHQCRVCQTERNTLYRKNNPEKRKETLKASYSKHRDKKLEYGRTYQKANPEKACIRSKRYAERYPERIAAYRERTHEQSLIRHREHYYNTIEAQKERARRYQRNHPEKGRVRRRIYRALKRSASGTHTTADVQCQYETQQGRCYYCQSDVGNIYHVDHYIPLSKGGSNGPENIVIACPTCNMRKNDRTPDDFMALLRAEKEAEEG